jgi:hypothetical protein
MLRSRRAMGGSYLTGHDDPGSPGRLLTRLRLRLRLLFILCRRLHSLLGRCRSLEHGNGKQPRDARCHLHRPADDAQSPTHGVEDGIPQLGLLRLGLALRHD